MNNDLIFNKFIENLTERAEHVDNKMGGGPSSDYGFGYMQSLLYNLLNEVPGVDVYLETHINGLHKLNCMEGIVNEAFNNHEND